MTTTTTTQAQPPLVIVDVTVIDVANARRIGPRSVLIEEGRIEMTGEPVLHGLFFSRQVSRRDHVAVYVVRQYRQDGMPEPNREIVACGFFGAGELPPDTTRGTRARIAEVLGNQPPTEDWI